jgi:L-cysteate sulfo-lyase
MSFQESLAAFPRLSLGQFPTPLEPLPRLTQTLGGPTLWVKRDDTVGPAMGGNKTRKLEFLFGEAQAQNAQAVATFGGLQSNFARQIVSGARRLGFEPHCFYFVPRPAKLEGNLFLNDLMGAKHHFVPFGQSDEPTRTVEATTNLVRLVSRLTPSLWGKRTFFMPVGGHTPGACLGYALAAQELEDQLREAGVQQATILMAAGTGGTLAGLMTGFHLLNSRHKVLGIDVGKLWQGFPTSIAHLASEICTLLGEPHTFQPTDVPLIERTYVGSAYAEPTPEAQSALQLLARTEGLILDPVYTAKAMSGLIDLVQHNHWSPTDHVVFLHTGGMPALWA